MVPRTSAGEEQGVKRGVTKVVMLTKKYCDQGTPGLSLHPLLGASGKQSSFVLQKPFLISLNLSHEALRWKGL